MKKKMMKRSLALGALMAFVITGTAMAGSIGTTTINGEVVKVDANGNFTVGADGDDVKIKSFAHGVSITTNKDIGEIFGKKIEIEGGNFGTYRGLQIAFGAKMNIGNNSTEYISIKTGGDIGAFVLVAHTDFNGKMLYIESTKDDGEGIHVANNTTDSTSPNLASVNVNTENTYIKAYAGLVAMSQGQLTVNSNITVDSKDAIITRGNAVTKINEDGKHTTQLNGDINFNYDEPTSGTKIDAQVVVHLNGKESFWNGNTKISWTDADLKNPTEDLLKVTNTQISLSNGAQWNVVKVNNEGGLSETGAALTANGTHYHALNNLKLDGGIVNLEKAGDQTVEIEKLEGKGEVVVANKNNSLQITKENNSTNLTVNATEEYSKELAKGDIAEGLQKVANQVVDNTTTGVGKSAADTVTMAETGVLGETTVQVDDNGKIIVETIKEEVNSSNAGIAQMGSIALMAWRQENNDMNKRLGELRNSNGEHGVWTRMTRGESEFQSIKNQYNAYQIGFDKKLSNDSAWTVGAALTYTDAQSSFAGGSGENTHKGFAVYGSKLNDDGSFIDLIAKYARLDHEFDALGGAGNGEYDTNGYSVSAEYGKRFDKGNGFWVEPQVELTYGKVSSANYKTTEGVTVAQDGMDSLVGRVGFSLGKDIKDGNVYVRASYLYDFDGETSMSFSDGKYTRTMEQDLGGGWFEVGVGTNINLSDATYLYFDVEKTYGGDVATPWQWNAGVRYSF